jgi:alkanesulfonate monooxygenase SsuD/methylene tetrahydromethanopterin reductase-like flavin-dependent oxidoreductase (luciferase family)
MKFRIGPFSMRKQPENPSSHSEIYRQTLEQVKLAEEVNFDSAWIAEHHFLEDGFCPSSIVSASAMAAVTKLIKIGTCALLLPLHNAVRVAEDAAVVDNISNGRFILGIGMGYNKEEFDGFGIPMNQRPSRMEEGIDVIIKSWTENNFSYEGKRYKFHNLNVTPKPVQKPHIPIYIGAIEEPAIRRVGKLGYPLLIGPIRTIQSIRDAIRIYNDAAREAGKNPNSTQHILIREVCIAENKKKAKEEGDRFLKSRYKFYFGLGARPFVRGKQIASLDDPLLDYFAEDRFIIGDPEDCMMEVKRYRDELGINYITSLMALPAATHETISRCIELFGKIVIPNVS